MNLSHLANINGSWHQNTLVTRVILCLLLLLVPAGQILVHSLAGSGLWNLLGLSSANIEDEQQPMGILFNSLDNFQYASLAMQNRLGIHFMNNLYTTEPHLAVLFNLYFFGIGMLSRFLTIQPIAIMTIISFAAAPIVGYTVFKICSRLLNFSHAASLIATGLVILGSGPSLVLHGLNATFSMIGIQYTIPLGSDYYLTDLFPVETFLILPYHSIALTFQVIVFSVILKALRTDLTRDPSRWVILSAVGIAILVLIRPYEGFIFTGLFLATLLLARLMRGEGPLFRFRDYSIITGMVAPFLCYIVWVQSLPGWRAWAHSAFTIVGGRTSLVVGFSAFWFLAVTGVVRVAIEKRLDMLILCLWTLSTMVLLIGFGGSAFKLAAGSVIAYGILGAFGLEKILYYLAAHPTRYREHSRTILCVLAATAGALTIFGTSLSAYDGMVRHQKIPRIDTEILAAAALIRQDNPNSVPTVLSDCSTALVLPALAGARVYSGHWGVTPDFKAKCGELELAGFEDRSIPAPSFDESRLEDIVAATKPDFVLIRRGASAEQWLLDHHATSAKMTGQRWSLLVMRE